MDDAPYNLAIETTGRGGEIALGRGDELLEDRVLPPGRRHNVELMAGIASLCEAHGVAPGQLGEIYVSTGPGSFTGIRVSIAIAQSLGKATHARLVAAPTIEVVAQNITRPGSKIDDLIVPESLIVCLSLKRETVWAAPFRWADDRWQPEQPPRVCALAELLDAGDKPIGLLGDPLPTVDDIAGHERLVIFDALLAKAHARPTWRIGRERAKAQRFVRPAELLPEYARRPEAVELWEQRHGPA